VYPFPTPSGLFGFKSCMEGVNAPEDRIVMATWHMAQTSGVYADGQLVTGIIALVFKTEKEEGVASSLLNPPPSAE